MNLQMDTTLGQTFSNKSQIARVRTEDWAGRELFCAACASPSLTQSPNNAKAIDFVCPQCQAEYQLKSAAKWNENRIVDAGYDAMMDKIQKDETPHLLVLSYSPKWEVENLTLVPRFFFSASSVQKRNPLALTARRAGWVGCNILLSAIATDGKLSVIQKGIAQSAAQVRAQYEKVKPLAKVSVDLRGWALDVFACIRRLGKTDFVLADVYTFENYLAQLHPENNNVQPKIRQQLQVLRNAGLVQFLSPGRYRLIG
ncbi:MAG: restriction endonuclease [Armatimonadetes bacterium]|nr:restriction endonuclease [Armatimonadota bacterium]